MVNAGRRLPSSQAVQYLIHQSRIHIYDNSMVNLRMKYKSMSLKLVCVLVEKYLFVPSSSLYWQQILVFLFCISFFFVFSSFFSHDFFAFIKVKQTKETIKKERNSATRILWRLFVHKSLSMHAKTEITSTSTWNIEKNIKQNKCKRKSSRNSITNE